MSFRILDELPSAGALCWPQWEDYTDFDASDEQPDEPKPCNTSSHFLRLPRELRDLIYGQFFEATRPAPPSPPFAGPRTFRLCYDGHEEYLEDHIAYPTSLARTNISALLHTNRTIRSEVLQLAYKRNASVHTLTADLDLMVSGHVVYPLWTCLPMLASPEVDLNVTVTIRIFSPESFCTQTHPSRPGRVFPRLSELLAQFITAGPAFTLLGKPDRDIPTPTIDTLTVRLHNLDIYTPRMFPRAVHEVVRACKGFAAGMPERTHIRRFHVVVEDSERHVHGLDRSEWTYDLKDHWDDLDPTMREKARNSMMMDPDVYAPFGGRSEAAVFLVSQQSVFDRARACP